MKSSQTYQELKQKEKFAYVVTVNILPNGNDRKSEMM